MLQSNPNISKYRQTGKTKQRKNPYSRKSQVPFDLVKDNLINTIQNLSSQVDSNALTQSIAPILSTVKFEKPQFKPRPKSSPFASQHDQEFKLDEKFVSALMPKESADPPSKVDTKDAEVNSSFVNSNNNGIKGDKNVEYQDLSDLHGKITSLIENESFLIVLNHLENLQKQIEEDIERRRQEIKNQHNQKRIDLYNLHRKRLEKQPERRNEVIARNNKEYKDLEKLLRKEMSDFEKQVSEEIDKATRDQQIILQNAGVPGFFPTSDSNQIALQSKILNLLTTAVKERALQKKAVHIEANPIMYTNMPLPPQHPPPPPPPHHFIPPQQPYQNLYPPNFPY